MRKFLLFAAIFAAGALFAGAVWFAIHLLREPARPALVAGLPTATAEIQSAWEKRLNDIFPAGTPEIGLIAALSADGFVFREDDGRLVALLELRPIVCAENYAVEWTIDVARRLQSISGDVHISCL